MNGGREGAGPGTVAFSAPGSLMLFGEHAVLRGEPAVVCAVDRRMTVRARRRTDGRVRVLSALGTLEFPARRIPTDRRFAFALEALRLAGVPPGGAELRIDSEFPSTIGLGSSAAAVVTVLAAAARLGGLRPSRRLLFERALRVILSVQGAGSGADAAASLWGGVLLFRAGRVRRIPVALPLVAAYSGHKTPTPEAIRRVADWSAAFPGLARGLFRLMGDCSRQAASALARGDLARVGALMNLHHGLHDAMGVNTQGLACLAFALRADPGIHGAKTSGAGLGDCVVGLGRVRGQGPGARSLDLETDPAGLRIETGAAPARGDGTKWGAALAARGAR